MLHVKRKVKLYLCRMSIRRINKPKGAVPPRTAPAKILFNRRQFLKVLFQVVIKLGVKPVERRVFFRVFLVRLLGLVFLHKGVAGCHNVRVNSGSYKCQNRCAQCRAFLGINGADLAPIQV